MSAPSQIPDSFDDDLVVFKSVAGAEKKPDINSSSATLDDSFDMPLEWTDATNTEHGPRSSPPPVVPFVGFTTAGTGQIVSVGEEALKKCRQILGKELSGDEISAQNTDQQFAGFFTSGTGKIVSVSEEALQKSRLVLDTNERNERSLDDPNTLERSCIASELTAASTTDSMQNMVPAIPVSSEAEKPPVFAGFTTAGSGKTVAVSKDALKKSKLILESSATDLCDTLLPLEGSGTVKPESLAHVKKLFEGGDSSSLSLRIPTVEGETKSNILGNEQKPVTVSTPNRVPIPNGASLFLGGRKQPFVSPLLTRSPLTVSGTSTGAVSVAPGTPILTSGVKRRRPVPSFKSPLLQKGNNVMDGVPTKEQVASPLVKVQLEEKKPRLEVVDADVAEYDSFDDSPSTSIVVEGKADPQLPLAGNLNASSTEARNGTPPVAEVTLQEKKPELESAGSAGTGAGLVRKDSFDESPNTSAIFTGDAVPQPTPPVGNPTPTPHHSVEPRTQDVTSEVVVHQKKPRLEPADAGIGLVRKDSFDESLSSTPVPIVIDKASASSSVQPEALASTANVEVPLEEKKHRLESVVQGTPADQCTSPTTSSRATAPVSPSTSIVEIAQVTDERTTFTVKVRICEFNGEPVYKGCTCCKSSFRKGDDGYERCNKCRGTEWNYYFRLRARIADMTGDHWCTFFDAPARRLLGCDAEHIHKLVKYNYDKYLEVLREKCMVFEFLMKIRQRKCNIGGKLIRTWNVEGISPVNPAENMDYLLAKRAQLTCAAQGRERAQLTGAAQERENVEERNQERNEERKE